MCPIIILYNNLFVNPGDFLVKKIPLSKPTKCDPSDLKKFMREQLKFKDEQFVEKIESYNVKLVNWIASMNSDIMQDPKLLDPNEPLRDPEFLKGRANNII